MASKTPKEQVEQFIEDTDFGRRLSQQSRDYFDGRQWTANEERKLRARRQAPIVVNRIKPKVEGLVGLYELRKSDPKAYPRTKKHEKAAHVVTDALRFVAENNGFDMTRLDVAEEFFVEGYGGVIVDIKGTPRGPEIQLNHIPWDRIYFDSHSRKKDFKDARFMGIWMWMEEDQAKDAFGISQTKIDEIVNMTIDGEETNADRPRWADKRGDRNRVRVAMHFFIKRGRWKLFIFSGDTTIRPEKDSPFVDEDGLPINPMELVSANINRDNQRYSEVAGFLSQQDEINHRRSKFLHLNSTERTFGNDNAIQDVDAAKKELAKPDGHLKIKGAAKLNEDFGILPTGEMSTAQFNLYMDAKSELDSVSFNAQLAGERQSGDLSGKAIGKLQQAGTIELNRQYALLRAWEKRIYTQIWFRVKQFWNEEKWIRVTDDQDDLRWVGFNSQVTAEAMLIESIEDESRPLESRQQSQQILQLLTQTQNPRLQEIVEVRNDTSELDVDIIIDQSFDVINIQQEQFEMIAQFANSGDFDTLELIELSQLRGKDELIQRIERRRREANQANQQAIQQEQQLDQAERTTEVGKKQAETKNIDADTLNKNIKSITGQLENINLQNAPDSEVQVSV